MLLTTLTETTKADCVSECRDIIDLSKKAMAARDLEIQDDQKTIRDLGTQINDITRDRDSDRQSLSAWYHNEFILVPIGILIGGAGAVYLLHK